tara:strand:+ start:151 stop:369 length:219 start_codon:yes stop_codon:yes gene_type:complete
MKSPLKLVVFATMSFALILQAWGASNNKVSISTKMESDVFRLMEFRITQQGSFPIVEIQMLSGHRISIFASR